MSVNAILVDAVQFSRFSSNTGDEKFCPFESGGSLWQVLTDQNNGLDTFVWVYQSTDYGATWTNIDAAGAITSHRGIYEVAQSGSTLHVFYQDASDLSLNVIPFDMGTGLWGAPDQLPGTTGISASSLRIGVLSDSSIVTVYSDVAAGLTWQSRVASVWSGAVIVDGTVAPTSTIVIGTDDSTNICYTIGSSNAVYFNNVQSDGTVGVRATVHAAPGHVISLGAGCLLGTKLFFPFVRSSGLNNLASVFVGDPYTAPVFTQEDIDITNIVTDVFSLVDGANVLVWAINFDATTIPITDRMVYYSSTGGGTWSGQTVFYDETANPPAGNPTPQGSQFLHGLSVAKLMNGNFAAGTALEFQQDLTLFCAGYFVGDTSTPPPPPPPVTSIISGGGGGDYNRSHSQTHWSIAFKGPRDIPCCQPEEYKPSGTAHYTPKKRTPAPPCCQTDGYNPSSGGTFWRDNNRGHK